jgi:hypothetical protein
MALFARLLPRLTLFALCVGFAGAGMTQAQSASPPAKPPPNKATKVLEVTKPLWGELKPDQHKALAPLQGEWLKMSEGQKRKWLEISRNYNKFSADDQTRLHARMADWVRLSPDQRATARLNFSVAKTLTPEEKQKQWEAYQALSPDEKTKLQVNAQSSTPNSAALAAKPQNKVLPGKSAAIAATSSATAPVSAPLANTQK